MVLVMKKLPNGKFKERLERSQEDEEEQRGKFSTVAPSCFTILNYSRREIQREGEREEIHITSMTLTYTGISVSLQSIVDNQLIQPQLGKQVEAALGTSH